MKHIIPILVILLLLSSGFVGVSNTAEELIFDAEEMDNLAFYYYDEYDSTKFEYYKEYFQRDSSEIADLEGITIPVESLQTSVSSGPMDSPWPMKCHDNRHTSRSPYSTADNPGDEIWRYKTSDLVEGGPIIDDDGTIYFGDFDYYLYALNPNGTMKWRYKTGGWITSTPALAEDGTLYVGSWDDSLYAFNSTTGIRKWKLNLGNTIGSSPAIGEDGTIYVGNTGGRIWAVNPNGTKKWYYDTGGGNIWGDPAIGDDGTIYVGTWFDYFYAINPNGTLKWRFKTGGIIKGPASIADDDTIYIGSWDDYLYALYPNNGTMKWKCKVGYGTETNPSIASDGTLYVGGWEALWAIYPNGTMRWVFNLGQDRHIHMSSPAISADGAIYVGVNIGSDAGGEILAINPDGTERWRKRIADYAVESSPCVGEDGTIYVGSTYDMGKGYLYAFGRGELEADADGPYYGLINLPVQFSGTASYGYPPYSYYWDFGDGNTSDEQNPMHTYTYPSNFTVTLTVTDNSSNISDDFTWAWIQASNDPPNKPSIDGETNGKVGVEYEYTFVTTDPDGNDVYYHVNWGDSTLPVVYGPYASGENATLTHTWHWRGTYTIEAFAEDIYGANSDWAYLKVTMPKNQNQQSHNYWFLQFLQTHPRMFPILRLLLGL